MVSHEMLTLDCSQLMCLQTHPTQRQTSCHLDGVYAAVSSSRQDSAPEEKINTFLVHHSSKRHITTRHTSMHSMDSRKNKWKDDYSTGRNYICKLISQIFLQPRFPLLTPKGIFRNFYVLMLFVILLEKRFTRKCCFSLFASKFHF